MQIVMDWLCKLLGLPQQFLSRTAEGSLAAGGGAIQGTASEATLVCMLAARARTMKGRPTSDMAKLVAYTSDQVTSHHHCHHEDDLHFFSLKTRRPQSCASVCVWCSWKVSAAASGAAGQTLQSEQP